MVTAGFPPKPVLLLLQSACCTALALIWWQDSLGIALLVGAVC